MTTKVQYLRVLEICKENGFKNPLDYRKWTCNYSINVVLCTGREISFFADGSRVAIDPDIIYDANGGRAFAHNLKLLGPTVKSITGPPSTKCCL